MAPPRMPPSRYTSEQRVNSVIRHVRNLSFSASEVDFLTKHPLHPFLPRPYQPEPSLNPKSLMLYTPSRCPSERKVKRLLTHLQLLEPTMEERQGICRYLHGRSYSMKGCAVDGRVYDEAVEFARERGRSFQWLVEEEEARKRHRGPYPYQTPVEIEYRKNWWKLGLPGL